MEKVIFTKYSKERSDAFKISTKIIKLENGQKRVIKSAATENAKEHIKSLYDKYIKLSDYYKKTDIFPSKCEIIGDNAVFDYIDGESFENYLDSLLDKGDFQAILKEIEKYIEVIKNNVEIVKFKACDEFKVVFGNNIPEKGVDSFKVSNIDLIFSNIIINDKWNVIDYEWTFDFPVPVNYVIYRAIKFYSEIFTRRRILIEKDIYSFLGISANDRKIYDKMEECFQSYTQKGHTTTWKLYKEIGQKNYFVSDIINADKKENENFVQIFYDYGDGLSEANSVLKYMDYNDIIEIEANIPTNLKALRIDPCNGYCIASINKFYGYQGEICYTMEFVSNGLKIGENSYIFTDVDPQFSITNLKEGTNKIFINMEVKICSIEVCSEISKVINDYNEKVFKAENQIRAFSDEITNSNSLIAELRSSMNQITSEKIAFEDEVKNKSFIIEKNQQEIANKENIIAEKEREIVEKNDIIAEKESEIVGKNGIIAEKESEIVEKEREIVEKNGIIAEKESEITNKAAIIVEKEKEIADKLAIIAEKESEITEKTAIIAEKENIIFQIQSSRFWKICTFLSKIKRILLFKR